MKKRLLPVIAFLPVVALALDVAFSSATAAVNTNGDLGIQFKVSGIAPFTSSTEFDAGATASATWGCMNRGGNLPRASSKTRTINMEATATGRFKPVNGTINGTMKLPVPDVFDFQCPTGQVKTLMSVTYRNVRLSSPDLNTKKAIPGVFSTVFLIRK